MTTASAFPAKSLAEISEILCAPGQRFEMETVDVNGVPTRDWKNGVHTLRELAMQGRTHGDHLFTIYEDERVSFDSWFRATSAFARKC